MHSFRGPFRTPSGTHVLPRRRAVHEAPLSRRALDDLLLDDLRDVAPEPLVRPPAPTEEASLLVVSRERAADLPRLRELLQGEPAIAIVVDRRRGERRTAGGEIAPPRERRLSERRRRFSFYLL